MSDIAIALLAIIAGGLAGSIINVLATRLPAEGDPPVIGPPLRPGSGRADAFGLVPWLGAWMRDERVIDLLKLATDIAATALVVVAWQRADSTFDALRAAVFALILLLILRIDWQYHLIFTLTIVPGIVVALAFQAWDSTDQLLVALLAAVIAAVAFLILFVLAILVYRQRALGLGDIYLAALIGAMAAGDTPAAILLGMFLGAVGGLFLILIRVRSRTDFIPYGAYLCLGAIVVVL